MHNFGFRQNNIPQAFYNLICGSLTLQVCRELPSAYVKGKFMVMWLVGAIIIQQFWFKVVMGRIWLIIGKLMVNC